MLRVADIHVCIEGDARALLKLFERPQDRAGDPAFRGTLLYDGYPGVALEMIDHRTFDDRIQLVEYRGVLEHPPREITRTEAMQAPTRRYGMPSQRCRNELATVRHWLFAVDEFYDRHSTQRDTTSQPSSASTKLSDRIDASCRSNRGSLTDEYGAATPMAQYPDEFINRLHLIWGPGFLSPGGPHEVREIVRGLDLRDALVLDIGCGTGGPAIVLAHDLGARVVGIDVEPQLIDHARRHADRAGVGDRIDFRLVEPGSLPFAAEVFDVVFSKDALIHIADKQTLYFDILRVLKPDGVFAASDWLSGENAADDVAFQEFVESRACRLRDGYCG